MINSIKQILREGFLLEINSNQAWEQFYSNEEKFPLLKGDKSLFDYIEGLYPKKNDQHNRGYFMWLYRLINDGKLKDEDFYKVKEYLRLFNKFINRISNDKRDINQYKSIHDLYIVVKDFESNEDDVSTSKTSEIKKIKREEIDRVYDDGDWLVLVPKTERASCLVGKGTQWCTAADKSNNMFDHYNSDGMLYVLISKYDDSKYQLHFESNQLMDVNDREVSAAFFFDHIAESNGLYNFLKGQNDRFYEFILETSVDDFADDGYSETFEEALSSLDDDNSTLKRILENLRVGDESRAVWYGYVYEKNPYNISDYEIKSLLERSDIDTDDLSDIIKHLVDIGYEFEDDKLNVYTRIVNGLKSAKLELRKTYKIDNGKQLYVDRLDLNNVERPIVVNLDGKSGNIDLDGLKSLVYNRSLFERILKK
jgi:hypothetical protein